jgi:hypothetical protein
MGEKERKKEREKNFNEFALKILKAFYFTFD